MMTLLIYLLEGSICIAIIYLFYKLALSELTFFSYNRVFLLSGLAISCIVPVISFQNYYENEYIPQYFIYSLPEFQVGQTSDTFNWVNIYPYLLVVYLSGAFYKSIRLVGGFLYIFKQLAESTKIKHDGQYIAINSKFEPSAFFNYVLLPHYDPTSSKDSVLILHESVHVKQLHSLDLLFIQILGIIFWFHPLLSLLEKSLREIHEYQADSTVIAKKSKKEYTMVLLELIKVNYKGKLSNNFNQFQTKKRILMMNRKSSEKHQKIRFLLSIPLFVIMLISFSCENTTEDGFPETLDIPLADNPSELDSEAARKAGANEIFDVVEDSPEYSGGWDAWNQYLSENLKYPTQARRMGIEGTVFIEFVVTRDGTIQDVQTLRGIGGGCDAEAMRVISESQKWIPGKQRGQKVNVRMRVPIRFKLD